MSAFIRIEADIPLEGLSTEAVGEILALVRQLEERGSGVRDQGSEKPTPGPRHPTPAPEDIQELKAGETIVEVSERRCELTECGRRLVRKRFANGAPESPKVFAGRRFCNRSCSRKKSVEKGHRHSGQKTPPLTDGRCCEVCGKPLQRKRRPNGLLEQRSLFKQRKTCGTSCANKLRRGVPKKGRPKGKGQRSDKNAATKARPLPDPRPKRDYQPGTLQPLNTGTCETCGERLNAFGVCGTCKRRESRQGMQRAKIFGEKVF